MMYMMNTFNHTLLDVCMSECMNAIKCVCINILALWFPFCIDQFIAAKCLELTKNRLAYSFTKYFANFNV